MVEAVQVHNVIKHLFRSAVLKCAIPNTLRIRRTLIRKQLSNMLIIAFFVFLSMHSGNNRISTPITLPIEEVLQTLQDLITYFQPPEEELEHEDKQNKLRSLKNRQNLFKEEVRKASEHFIHAGHGIMLVFMYHCDSPWRNAFNMLFYFSHVLPMIHQSSHCTKSASL